MQESALSFHHVPKDETCGYVMWDVRNRSLKVLWLSARYISHPRMSSKVGDGAWKRGPCLCFLSELLSGGSQSKCLEEETVTRTWSHKQGRNWLLLQCHGFRCKTRTGSFGCGTWDNGGPAAGDGRVDPTEMLNWTTNAQTGQSWENLTCRVQTVSSPRHSVWLPAERELLFQPSLSNAFTHIGGDPWMSPADSCSPLKYQILASHYVTTFFLLFRPLGSGGNLERIAAHSRNCCFDSPAEDILFLWTKTCLSFLRKQQPILKLDLAANALPLWWLSTVNFNR